MGGYIQESFPARKPDFYPRDTGAIVCHGARVEKTPTRRIRGKDIRLPRVTMEWDQRAFARRIRARVEQLNATMEGLAKKAGGRGDEIRKAAQESLKKGPTVSTITFVAMALNWTIGQAMGTVDPTLDLRRDREIDPRKLQIALQLADLAAEEMSGEIDSNNPRYANMVSMAYSWVSDREASGRAIDVSDSEFLDDAISLLRHL